MREQHPVGHTRAPRYTRGKPGEVIHVAPASSLPDAAAHALPERREASYHVLFKAETLWTDPASPNETVVVELWDSYLELDS